MFNFPDNVNPLTGLVVDDPSRLERRPVMVKVSNFPRTGRPHAGLSFADIVFEYYIGYGMNRFCAFISARTALKLAQSVQDAWSMPSLVKCTRAFCFTVMPIHR